MEKGITVVGLGPGSAGHLSLETMAVLKSGGKVILRTAVHPTVKELERSGIKFTSCDAVYEQEASFEDVYQKIVASILQDAKEAGGSLCCSRQSFGCRTNCGAAEGTGCSGRSASENFTGDELLDLAYVDLGIDPIAGLRIVDAHDLMRWQMRVNIR